MDKETELSPAEMQLLDDLYDILELQLNSLVQMIELTQQEPEDFFLEVIQNLKKQKGGKCNKKQLH